MNQNGPEQITQRTNEVIVELNKTRNQKDSQNSKHIKNHHASKDFMRNVKKKTREDKQKK